MSEDGHTLWGRSVRIARLVGFDVKIDISWVLIAALVVWSLSQGYFPSVLPGASPETLFTMSVAAAIALFGSLILHELAHSLVARRHGIRIKSITLFLFGGVAEMEDEPPDAATEFRVAVAGPLASFALSLAFWVLAMLTMGLPGMEAVQAVLLYLAVANLILAVFNLLPAFPLDGGRVYRAILWGQIGDQLEATRRAARLSTVTAYGLIALGIFTLFNGAVAAGIWPIMIGLFLLAASTATYRQLLTRKALHGLFVANLMTTAPWTAEPDQTLQDLVDQVFLNHSVSFAPVMAGARPIGYIDLHLLTRIDRENWATTTVNDVFEGLSARDVVGPRDSAPDLLERITRTGQRKFLVIDDGRLAGVVTLSDFTAYLNVAAQVPPQTETRDRTRAT